MIEVGEGAARPRRFVVVLPRAPGTFAEGGFSSARFPAANTFQEHVMGLVLSRARARLRLARLKGWARSCCDDRPSNAFTVVADAVVNIVALASRI